MESAGDEGGAAGPDLPAAVAQTETRQVDVHLPVADLASGACASQARCCMQRLDPAPHTQTHPTTITELTFLA